MECLLGIKGPDFVMLSADMQMIHSIMVMKEDQSKIHKVADNIMIGTVGEAGDTVQFTEFIAKNIALYKMRNGYDLTAKCASHFTRRNLASYLRSRTAYMANMLVAGFDEKEGPELTYIDYLANAKSVKYGGHGYGSMFCASVFDRYHHDQITKEEAYEVLKKCISEIQKRLVISLKNFEVVVVDKDGIRELPKIDPETLKA